MLQRVKKASVKVKETEISSINNGVLVFVGIHHEDTHIQMKKMVKKILELRFFNDENQKMNLSCIDTHSDILLVSQFTLYGDCSKGRRPSYIEAAEPKHAQKLYEEMIKEFKLQYKEISTGQFGAMMEVSLINDGPVTLFLNN